MYTYMRCPQCIVRHQIQQKQKISCKSVFTVLSYFYENEKILQINT